MDVVVVLLVLGLIVSMQLTVSWLFYRWGANLAEARGRGRGLGWWAVGFGVIAIFVIAMLPRRDDSSAPNPRSSEKPRFTIVDGLLVIVFVATLAILAVAVMGATGQFDAPTATPKSSLQPTSTREPSPLVREQVAIVEAQHVAHLRYVEGVKLRGLVACGERLSANVVSDWPFGRVFQEDEPVSITIEYDAPGCTEVIAFLHIRCAEPCAAADTLLADDSRPLVEGNGRFVVAHGFVFPTDDCNGTSEWCRQPGQSGFELCALTLAFYDPWPDEEFDLISELEKGILGEETESSREYSSRRVEFGETCFVRPVQPTTP